ncbi:hypothetical protein HAX54_039659 [Datura stramonium]|uniref:Uncharacterized protein n=1 Tax=Datura stramonium TaxID=4076 RepID=A0ABS8SJ59_DATST|nr:hypothetical protein [Datura stramonium]
MSARMLSSITEDQKDLQKKIGCMNGLFQLFDRHHFLIGKHLHGQNHKRLLTGATDRMETKCTMQSASEKTPREVARNKVSHSSESSKASSKLEQNKRPQQEQPFCSQRNLPESPSKSAIQAASSPSHSGRQSPDFRDVVKDSMHRKPVVICKNCHQETCSLEATRSQQNLHKSSARNTDVELSIRTPKISSSVYGEMEKGQLNLSSESLERISEL